MISEHIGDKPPAAVQRGGDLFITTNEKHRRVQMNTTVLYYYVPEIKETYRQPQAQLQTVRYQEHALLPSLCPSRWKEQP